MVDIRRAAQRALVSMVDIRRAAQRAFVSAADVRRVAELALVFTADELLASLDLRRVPRSALHRKVAGIEDRENRSLAREVNLQSKPQGVRSNKGANEDRLVKLGHDLPLILKEAVAVGLLDMGSLALDGTNVYWTDGVNGAVRKAPKDGGASAIVNAAAGTEPWSVDG